MIVGRNSLLFLAVSLLGFGRDTIKDTGISKERVWERAIYLSKMLDNLFVQESIKLKTYDQFLDTINLMHRRKIIIVEGDLLKYETPNNQTNGLVFLCSLIWPFIDTIWLTLVYIYTRFPDKSIGETKINTKIQWFAESLYEDNIVLHYESCSIDFISREVEYFISEGFIIKNKSSPDETTICLCPEFQKNEGLIQEEFDKLIFYKKLSVTKFTNLKIDIQKTMLSDFPTMSNL
jgi:hypothetical protein